MAEVEKDRERYEIPEEKKSCSQLWILKNAGNLARVEYSCHSFRGQDKFTPDDENY
jgi:hypothetical protein